MIAAGQVPHAADDARVIECSWHEPERFAVLFDRHAPRIHRYVARRVGREVADDLVAETFLAAFGQRRRYDLRYADATPWLYGIATNLIGRHRRDEARQLRILRALPPELPGHAPRPNQFVYMEFVSRSSQSRRSWLSEEWLSVDGTQTGLYRFAGKYTVLPGCALAAGHGCEPAPAVLPDLPTTPRAMLTYLEKTDSVRPGDASKDNLNKLGKGADELLAFYYLLPKQRAALYEVLAQTPGFSVTPHAFDAAGRPGIGISWIFVGGSKTMIIFDPRAYVELGFDTWGAGSDRNVEESSGLLKIAIVDRVGQLP